MPHSKLRFSKIKDEILGKKYDLSLVFSGDQEIKKLNKTYCHKNYTPNILSFPLDKDSGEIFINLKIAEKESPKYEMDYKTYVLFLFIHGCLHLKGHDHGKKMENLEDKFLKKLKVKK